MHILILMRIVFLISVVLLVAHYTLKWAKKENYKQKTKEELEKELYKIDVTLKTAKSLAKLDRRKLEKAKKEINAILEVKKL